MFLSVDYFFKCANKKIFEDITLFNITLFLTQLEDIIRNKIIFGKN